jgi:hypothetical protein
MPAGCFRSSFDIRPKLRSPNGRTAGGAWSSKPQSWVVRTGVSDLRCAAALAQAFVRFRPGGESGFRLAPMRDRGFIAPIQKMRHRSAVGARRHELTHTLLSIPGSHCPEGPASVSQERALLKSMRLLYLPHRAERIKYKARYETKGPDSQAGKADENHHQLTTPAILLPESVCPAKGPRCCFHRGWPTWGPNRPKTRLKRFGLRAVQLARKPLIKRCSLVIPTGEDGESQVRLRE